ncbi:Mu transposase C-terminal domain-containing protein [Gracilibacillus dipsosauri]|nr:Mu transposase C-terminal domain-containing protein [Gracilibacillus dipsosauri]
MIIENSIIELHSDNLSTKKIERVLWISKINQDVILVDITDHKNKKLPHKRNYGELINDLDEGRARILELEPDLRILSPDDEYLETHKKSRDANWDIIKDIAKKEPSIYNSRERGRLIKETVEKTGKNKKIIYDLLKKYWFYGKSMNGLLKNYTNCGAPGKERQYKNKTGPKSKNGNNFIVEEKDKKIFDKALKKYHIKGKMSLKSTHEHMCEEYYNEGYYRKYNEMVPIVSPKNGPTLRQFLYWYHKSNSFGEKYAKRYGERKRNMDVRILQGDASARALAVGYLYEIDSTPADVILVAEDRKTIIGTPTLYIVKDVFSRMIVGFHASLSPPSWVEQMVALENAATNKVEFCRQYGIDIEQSDWPCLHLPKYLVGDRGELKGKKAEQLVNLKVDVMNAPSYRGDLKPYVEQHFRLTNHEIRDLLSNTGAKPPELKKRGEHDPAREASLTIKEFIKFMIVQIITFNKKALPKDFFVTKDMFQENVDLTPIDVWNWGANKRLLHEKSRMEIRYNLLPKGKGKVTRRGIEFEGMYYTCDFGIKEGWFEEEKIDGNRKLIINYDPRNVSRVFLKLRSGKLEPLRLTEKYKEYEDLHLEDVRAIMRYKKEQIYKKTAESKQFQAELHTFSQKLVKVATEETKKAIENKSIYERKKDKRAKRKVESRNNDSRSAWSANASESSNNRESNKDIVSFPNNNDTKSNNEDLSNIYERFSAKNRERRSKHGPRE